MADETQHQQDQQRDAQKRADAPEPAQAAQDQGQDRAGAQEPPTERDEATETSDVSALRHEAASRRRALRTVEAERDQLKGRIDARDRAEVEAIASNFLADASDFTGTVELDSLRGDDGAGGPRRGPGVHR